MEESLCFDEGKKFSDYYLRFEEEVNNDMFLYLQQTLKLSSTRKDSKLAKVLTLTEFLVNFKAHYNPG